MLSINTFNLKVFLVVGGRINGAWPSGRPSPSEILVEGASAWQKIQSLLSYGAMEPRTLSFNNQILIFGIMINSFPVQNNLLLNIKVDMMIKVATNILTKLNNLMQKQRLGKNMAICLR